MFACEQASGEPRPAHRRRHTAVHHNNRMYIFGGKAHSHNCFEYLQDLWALDLSALQWEQLPALLDLRCTGHAARTGHAAVAHAGSMWVFGGFAEVPDMGKLLMNGVLRFDFETQVLRVWGFRAHQLSTLRWIFG